MFWDKRHFLTSTTVIKPERNQTFDGILYSKNQTNEQQNQKYGFLYYNKMESEPQKKTTLENLLTNIPVYLQKVKCDTTERYVLQ